MIRWTVMTAVLAACALASGVHRAQATDGAAPTAAANSTTQISRGERIVLFPTTGALSADGAVWRIPVHGWVFATQQSRVRKSVIAELFQRTYGLKAEGDDARLFDRRINLLLADNLGGRRVIVRIGDSAFALPASAPNGHFKGLITLPAAVAERAARDGSVAVAIVTPALDGRSVETRVPLLAAEGLTIISDIDDTVKITEVRDKKKLWANTFFKPFAAVPGMADLYRRLAAEGAAVHFVSTSPWHLYEPLAEFLSDGGFPAAAFTLKQIRLKDASILDIAKPGADIKPPMLAEIVARYPRRRFLLIGDSGEQDPEVYADAMRRYPGQIKAVWIRNVTAAKADDARFTKVFAGLPRDRWRLFDDPAELADVKF